PATGVISGALSGTASDDSPYSVTVTAAYGSSSASATFSWAVSNLTLSPIPDQFSSEGESVSWTATARDSDNDTLTFSASGLPDGLDIDPDTGEIAGTLPDLSANDSPSTVTVSVSDGTHSASQTFVWHVTFVLLDNPGDLINLNGDSVTLPLHAFDP